MACRAAGSGRWRASTAPERRRRAVRRAAARAPLVSRRTSTPRVSVRRVDVPVVHVRRPDDAVVGPPVRELRWLAPGSRCRGSACPRRTRRRSPCCRPRRSSGPSRSWQAGGRDPRPAGSPPARRGSSCRPTFRRNGSCAVERQASPLKLPSSDEIVNLPRFSHASSAGPKSSSVASSSSPCAVALVCPRGAELADRAPGVVLESAGRRHR